MKHINKIESRNGEHVKIKRQQSGKKADKRPPMGQITIELQRFVRNCIQTYTAYSNGVIIHYALT